jgi:hypothetical protein
LVTRLGAEERGFCYKVYDEVKNDKVDYELGYDCSVSTDSPLVFSTSKAYKIHGCAQKSFSFQEENLTGELTREDFERFLRNLQKIEVNRLRTADTTTCRLGWLRMNEQNYLFNNPLTDLVRVQLHSTIGLFFSGMISTAKRRVTLRTTEGDFERPQSVTVAQILASPDSYQDKRVHLTGFHHSGFEDDRFSDVKGEDRSCSLWLGRASSFATISEPSWEDGPMTVEGIFVKGPAGHLGGWPGELIRLTKISR